MRAKFLLSPAAATRLKQRIAQKAGARIRVIFLALHKSILERTPMNTGRTLGSWAASAGSPVFIDIGESGGFEWDPSLPHTNHLPPGKEGGDRSEFESASLRTASSIDFEANPYRTFYIANGAKLDSGAGIGDLKSSLPQGRGSRAYAQEYGYIAAYSVFHDEDDYFFPRGTYAVHFAVEKVKLEFGRK